jgi:GDP-L-fucose synthase
MANAFLWCFKNYSSEKIINIGSDEERKIKEIVFYVAKAINLNLDQIMFDKTKPKGVHKKSMSNKNFIKISKFKFLPLKDGIKKTINWYIKNYDKIKLNSKI